MRPHPPWRSRRALALGTAVLSVGALAACSSSSSTSTSTSTSTSASSSPSSSTPITIGASLSLTGDFSTDGINYQHGYELWASYVNAHGGLLGRQVVLKILNDNSSPTQVVTNYQTLFSSDHVDLAFGPFSSLLTTPASSVAARYGYAFVEGAGGAPTRLRKPGQRGRPQRVRREPADQGRDGPVRQLHRGVAAQPAAEDRRLPDGRRPVRHPAGPARAVDAAAARGEDRVLQDLPGGGGGLQGAGRPGGRHRRADRGAGIHRRADRVGLHVGVRAAALHAEAVHRGGRPRPGFGLHVRGG